SYIGSAVDKLVSYLEAFYLKQAHAFKLPSIPDPATAQALYQQYVAEFGTDGNGGTFAQQIADATNVAQQINNWLSGPKVSPLARASVGGISLDQIFAINGSNFLNPDAIEKFKNFLTTQAALLLQTLLPLPGEGLLFGGATALTDVLKTAFNL